MVLVCVISYKSYANNEDAENQKSSRVKGHVLSHCKLTLYAKRWMTQQAHASEPDINAGLTDLWQKSAYCLRKPNEKNLICAV